MLMFCEGHLENSLPSASKNNSRYARVSITEYNYNMIPTIVFVGKIEYQFRLYHNWNSNFLSYLLLTINSFIWVFA